MGTCGACGADNREGARFCASCGGGLLDACRACGAVPARAGARFCDTCGAALGGESPPVAAAQARKVVTILFADLVGSTAAQEGMDPESARRWIETCHVALRGAVEAHQGRVVKFTGDGVMAVFGVPDVREDDAPRALHAAVDLHRAIAEVPPPSGLAEDARFALRVGVNTGEVVVTAGDTDVVGDAVNVAARLEQAAGPGEVLVGETTYRLVRLVAQLRALPPLDLKGKAEPVPAFRLVSLDPPTDAAAGTPFVGRAGELERLSAVLDVAIEERRPQLVTVVGSPGVGKSRLARELASTASDRARVVEVRCDPDGTSTFAPVAAALRAAAGLDDDAGADTVVAALTALFPEDEPDRERIAHVAAGVLGVEEPGLPEETFWAVRRLIENAARLRPHLFVFEDVHWAEPLLLDLIDNVAEWARDVPVLLVATARPEVRELRPTLVEVGRRVRAVVVLEGLAIDESRRLTRALLEGTVLPDRLLDRIAAASEGNPLFVRELVRMLVEDGALRPGERRWEPTVAVEDIEVPPSIQAVLAARIDRLAPAEQEVLGAASVVGREFSRGAVAALVEPATQARLDEVLEGLRRKELVESTGTYWLDEPLLRFHHALVLDAAYRRLLKTTRAELHERAARWLEQKAGDLVEQDDAIGLQLERAHLLAAETGRPDEALGHQAAARLAAAGRRALEADDQGGAATFLGRALRCLPAEDPGRPDLLIDRCESLLSMGDATDAGPVVDELLAVAGDDPRAGAWAECFVGELANLRDAAHLAETAERVRAAAEALAEQGDAAGEAKAHAVLATSLARLGRIGDSEAALDRALAAARRAGDRRRATAILAGAPIAALWGPNPVTRASGRCLDVVRVLRITSRSPAVEATSLRCQAVLEALRGRADAARRMVASARRSLEELGHEHGLVEVDLAAGTVELLAGDLEAAQGLLERAHEGFHGLGIDVDAARAAALLARVHLGRGAADAALELTTEAEELGGDDLKAGIAWRSVRAEALARRGDLDEARRLAEAAVALAAPTDALVDHADALVALAEVLRISGETEGAAARAGEALELYERKEASVPADRARAFLGRAPATATSAMVERSAEQGGRSEAGGANQALRALIHMCDLVGLADAGLDAVRAAVHPEMCFEDHRPLFAGTWSGVDSYVDGCRAVVEVGVRAIEPRGLAQRGDHLCLARLTFLGAPDDPIEGAVDVLQLIEVDEEGLLVRNDAYDVDQLDEALAELDARWARWADGSAPTNAAVRLVERISSFVAGSDALARASELVRPDVWYEDRRPIVGTPQERGVAAYVAVSSGVLAIGVKRIDIEALDVRGDRLCLLRVTYRGGDEADPSGVLETIHVAEVHPDGRLAGNVLFEPEQIDEAEAELERRWREHLDSSEVNRATQAGVRLARGLEGEDPINRLRPLLHPEVVLDDRRPVLGSPPLHGVEPYLEVMASLIAIGVGRFAMVPLEERGERLALVRVRFLPARRRGTEYFLDVLHVLEVAADDRIMAHVSFEPEQIDEAVAELERRYRVQRGGHLGDVLATEVAGEASQAVAPLVERYERLLRRMLELGLAGEWDAYVELFHPDVELIDARPLVGGLRHRGRAEVLAVDRGIVEVGVDAMDVEVLATRGDRLVLDRRSYRGPWGQTETIQVAELDDEGRIRRNIAFDADQLDDALAELDARFLAGSEAGHADAWRPALELVRTLTAHDRGPLEAILHPEMGVEDHRPLGWGRLERAAFLAMCREMFLDAPDARWDLLELLGTSERAVYGRMELAGTQDGTSFSLAHLAVAVVDEGRIAWLELFALEDRATAGVRFAALVDSDGQTPAGATENAAVRAIRAASTLMGERRWEELEALLHPHVQGRDRRAVVGGYEISGAAAQVASWQTYVAMDDWERTVVPAAQLGDRACVVRVTHRAPSAEVELLQLVVLDEEGLVTNSELFEADALDAATARLHELAGTRGPQSAAPALPDNAAVRGWVWVFELGASGRHEAYRAAVRADARVVDHRPLVGWQADGHDEVLRYLTSAYEVGATTLEWEVFAVRGERLALGRSTFVGPDAALEVLTLNEVDEDGLAWRLDLYDLAQLQEAAEELNARYVASLPPGPAAAWRVFAAANDALNRHDLDAVRATFTEDMVVVDHRPMSLGEVAGETWLESVAAGFEESADVRWPFTAVLELCDRAALSRAEMHGTRDGGPFTGELLVVSEARDGRLARLEYFPPDQLVEARDRYAEVAAAPQPPTANTAVRAFDGAFAVLFDGDPDALRGFYTSDVVVSDHRSIVGGLQFEGSDEAVENVRSSTDSGVAAMHRRVLGVAGDTCCLLEVVISATDGGAEVRTLMVVALDEAGLVRAADVYDETELVQARARLAELAAGSG